MVGEAEATRERPASDALLGRVLNERFHIVRPIARGGMGTVYYATQAPLNRPVAVKVLHVLRDFQTDSSDTFGRRFLLEASILSKLQHPNIVTLLDYGKIEELEGENYFMAMEYLPGDTLAQRFRARGRLSVAETIRLTRQIARGLREAHRSGFVHRDLKPSNIILVPEDERNDIVKLVDFGVGKIMPGRTDRPDPDEDVTRAGLVLGSPRYMSPEQVRCAPVEPRTDLYGLGVILFQALTGRLPFEADNSMDVMIAHCLTPPPELQDVCPEEVFPESLSEIVRALLEKQPVNRPTIDEFLARLAELEDELFGSAGVTASLATSVALRTLQSAHSDPPRSRAASGFPASKPSLPPDAVTTAVLKPPSRMSSRPWGRLLWAAGAALLLLGGLAAFGHSRVGGAPRAVSAAAVPLPQLAARAAEPPKGPDSAPVTGALAFELALESTPTGALVTEDGEVLGVTPLSVQIERRSVVAASRRFILHREGYAPYTLNQGDSESTVRVSAVLLPELSPDRRSAPGNRAPSKHSLGGSGERTERKRKLEIRMRR